MPHKPTERRYGYGRQTIDDNDVAAVVGVLRSDRLTQGPAVPSFENALAETTGATHAVAVANGTAALHLTALALGWGRDDIVITTPLTFAATVNCIVYAGGRPEFVDVDERTGCIEPSHVSERVSALHEQGKRVRAVIATDYAGHPCDWDALRDIGAKHELQLVDDACHSLGATRAGRRVGSDGWADATVFSFHPVKAVTTAEGGAVVTHREDVADAVRRLRTHGVVRDPELLESPDGPWYYEMHDLGFNYRLSDVQAALGTSQLSRLETFLDRRRTLVEGYGKRLSNVQHGTVPVKEESVVPAWHLYPYRIDFDAAGVSRTELFARMARHGVQLQVHYIPVHLHPYYRRRFGYGPGMCPAAETWYAQEVSLPLYPDLTDSDLDYIVDALTKSLGGA